MSAENKWFEIKNNWLCVGDSRYNLLSVDYYRLNFDIIDLRHHRGNLDAIYVPVPTLEKTKELMEALDKYFGIK